MALLQVQSKCLVAIFEEIWKTNFEIFPIFCFKTEYFTYEQLFESYYYCDSHFFFFFSQTEVFSVHWIVWESWLKQCIHNECTNN